VIKARRENRQTDFHTCCADFPVSIGGASLIIRAAPFLEQDGRVQTCSSIAMYVSTCTMSHCFNLSKYNTSEIMERSTRVLVGPRAGPTIGLSVDQIMSGLREIGYDPIMFWEADEPETIYRIYSYVESGVPAILLLELPNGTAHAVTVVGHKHRRPEKPRWQVQVTWLGKHIIQYYRSSEWVPTFYVHDDQRGLYRELSFTNPDPRQIAQSIQDAHQNTLLPIQVNDKMEKRISKWHCPVEINIDLPSLNIPQKQVANLWGIIAPMPRGITISHAEAESKSSWVIRRCFDRLGLNVPDDLVLRTYLIRSNDYKNRLKQSIAMHQIGGALYSGKSMPKWL